MCTHRSALEVPWNHRTPTFPLPGGALTTPATGTTGALAATLVAVRTPSPAIVIASADRSVALDFADDGATDGATDDGGFGGTYPPCDGGRMAGGSGGRLLLLLAVPLALTTDAALPTAPTPPSRTDSGMDLPPTDSAPSPFTVPRPLRVTTDAA